MTMAIGCRPVLEQQMGMVGHQCPGIAGGFSLSERFAQSRDKPVPVSVVEKIGFFSMPRIVIWCSAPGA